MKRCLLFISRNYPHQKGEPFIENEIAYLDQHFDKVILISSLTVKNPVHTRTIPAGVDLMYNSRSGYARSVLRNLGKSYFYKNLAAELKEAPRVLGSPRRLAKCAAFSSIPDEAVRTIWKEIKHIPFKEYDEIVVYSYWFHYTAAIAIKLKELIDHPHIKVVSRAHRYDIYEHDDQDQYIPFRQYLLNNTDKVVCISEDGRSYLATKYPDYRENIMCSRLGVPDRGCNPNAKPNELFHIVTCSRVEPVKRLDQLIAVLAHLPKDNEVRWSHFGDGSLMSTIRNQAETLPNHIKWTLKGAVTNSDLMSYYAAEHVDLFINVSESEGIPVSIMEASSFGIPVIATNVGGTAEIVRDGINGHLLSKDFKVAEAAKWIETMIRQPYEKKMEQRENARQLWAELFDSKKNYTNFLELLSS